MKVKVVKPIAEKVRFWAEDLWRETGAGDLCGCCAIASAKLFNELKAAGLNPILHYADSHVHVRIEDKIIDVTATQFGDYPPVLITTIDKLRTHRFKYENPWDSTMQFETVVDLRDWMIKCHWIDEQVVPEELTFGAN